VHLWLGDTLETKQSYIDWLINDHQVSVIVGDFNIYRTEFNLPPHWSKEGHWDGVIFDTRVLEYAETKVLPALDRCYISDHNFQLMSFIVV
jgi:hypothetical protein